jgi:hypothetical protein
LQGCSRRRQEEFTPEEQAEHARIGREYNRQCFIRHNRYQKDLALKAWLMNEAFNNLPAHLKEHAGTIDASPPPENLPIPEWHTPPIKDFNVQDYVKGFSDE